MTNARGPVITSLVKAALSAMSQQSEHTSISEFTSATLTLAERGIDIALDAAKSPEQREAARALISEALMGLFNKLNANAN